jgi:sortase B
MRSNWGILKIILFMTVFLMTACQSDVPVSSEPSNVTLQTTEHTEVTEESTAVTVVTEATEAPTEVTEPEGIQEDRILEKYLPYYQQNQDMVGWIRLPGTKIDYPVLQTSIDNLNYYIDVDFNRQPNVAGSIYIREVCNVFQPSGNVVIYGHNMKNETMFGSLYRYRNQSHWEKNQYIYFDNLYEEHTYQIFAVFAISADLGNYPYHEMNEFATAEEFDDFIAIVTNGPEADPAITQTIRYYYDTGIVPKFGTQLITLSTCTKTVGENGRLVLVAYRVS